MAVSPNNEDLLLGIRNGRHELHSLEIAVVVGDGRRKRRGPGLDKLRRMWPVLVAAAMAADEIPIASFAASAPKALRHTWSALNDPVMGGQSTSRVAVENSVLNFTGHCAIVPSLKAPGFSECLPCLSLPFSHAESDCHCHSPCHTITTC